MYRTVLVVAALGCAPTAVAQGVMPLNGTYSFGVLGARLSCQNAGTGSHSTFAERAQSVFQASGAFTATYQHREVCQGNANVTNGSPAGSYEVTKEGAVVLDWNPAQPGTDTERFALNPDGTIVARTRDANEPEAYLAVGVQLSSNQSNGSLSGNYAMVRLLLNDDASGLSGAADLGTMQFNGAGNFTETKMRQSVSVTGTTILTSLPAINGTYGVASNGALTIGSTGVGAIAPDRSFFFSVGWNGTSQSLTLGVRRGTAITSDDLLDDWALAVLSIWPGAVPLLATDSILAEFSATSATTGVLSLLELEVETDPSGTTVYPPGSSALNYTIASNGDLTLTSTLWPGIIPARVSAGAGVLIGTPADVGEAGIFVGLHLCPVHDYGSATPGTAGRAPVLDITGGYPVLGNGAFRLQVRDGLANSVGAIALTTRDLPGFPFFGGLLWVDPTFAIGTPILVFLDNSGTGSIPVPLPAQPHLARLKAYVQAMIVDPGAPANFSFTGAMDLRLCN